MSSTPSLTGDQITRASTAAAEDFTEAYYTTLSNDRKTVASFYIPHTSISPERSLPAITYNGTQLSDPDAFQKTYMEQMPFTYFEVQSLNVHVMNPQLTEVEGAGKGRGVVKEMEQNMSLLVQVSGYVRLMERKEGPMRGFSDNMVLVPNKSAAGAKGKSKTGEGRSWLIQTQNFRFVV